MPTVSCLQEHIQNSMQKLAHDDCFPDNVKKVFGDHKFSMEDISSIQEAIKLSCKVIMVMQKRFTKVSTH